MVRHSRLQRSRLQRSRQATIGEKSRIGLRFAAAVTGACLLAQNASAADTCLRGVNLAGAEFGELADDYGKGYIYPSPQTIEYFAGKGFTAVRLPFLWERLQPVLYKGFSGPEARRLARTVALIRSKGMVVVLDPHNYARYRGNVIGSDETPQSAFADFWRRLSTIYANQDGVTFGLMNEPHDISAENWLSAANSAIAAIRATGARNLVLVPGTAWTGAHSWMAGDYGTPNASAMLNVADPGNNYAYEVHQYLDADFSGKAAECSRAADAVKAIGDLTAWLRSHGKHAFLGEFAVPTGGECQSALADMVSGVERNADVWLGWSYWAGGDWWPADEPMNIQPQNGADRPQMATLSRIFITHPVCGP